MLINLKLYFVFLSFSSVFPYRHHVKTKSKLQEYASWKQISYDFDGVLYTNSTDFERNPNSLHFQQDLDDSERFFIQYNNVPIGMEVYGEKVFVTVPRRRHGIPSTLNFISSSSKLLRPYPDVLRSRQLVSVYRPRVDACHRLWMVDTGLLEVPEARKQVQRPAIIIFDLETDEQLLRYELKDSDLVNERTSAGFTSITVDVTPQTCADAYAYINDLATEGMIVFSLKRIDSWRVEHPSFRHDEASMNFSVAGHTINWRDGLFSIALSDFDSSCGRLAYYHALISNDEYAVDTDALKRGGNIDGDVKKLGYKGPLTQSGSHAYHSDTRTLLYANVAQDAILCWNVDCPMTPENVAIVSQDRQKLVYISDLKVVDDHVWVLVNQIPRFIYSTLDTSEKNYFIHKGKIQNLIEGTPCDRWKKM